MGARTARRGAGLRCSCVAGFVWASSGSGARAPPAGSSPFPAAVAWFTLAVFAHTSYVARRPLRDPAVPDHRSSPSASRSARSTAHRATRRSAACGSRPRWSRRGSLVLVLPYQVRVVGTKPRRSERGRPPPSSGRSTSGASPTSRRLLRRAARCRTSPRAASRRRCSTPCRCGTPGSSSASTRPPPDQVAFLFPRAVCGKPNWSCRSTAYERIDLPGYELYVPVRTEPADMWQ